MFSWFLCLDVSMLFIRFVGIKLKSKVVFIVLHIFDDDCIASETCKTIDFIKLVYDHSFMLQYSKKKFEK